MPRKSRRLSYDEWEKILPTLYTGKELLRITQVMGHRRMVPVRGRMPSVGGVHYLYDRKTWRCRHCTIALRAAYTRGGQAWYYRKAAMRVFAFEYCSGLGQRPVFP